MGRAADQAARPFSCLPFAGVPVAVRPPFKLVIVGGGTAGWMAAAAFSAVFKPHQMSIQLVESSEIGIVGVGEATLPHIRFFNRRMGIDERELMARTQATFKLGIEFRDWARIGDSYIHPFGVFGGKMAGVPFHNYWLRQRAQGVDVDIESYSLPIMAARANRFAPPSEDHTSVLSTFGYAFQFDASLYAAYLRVVSEGRGVHRTDGKIVDFRMRGEDGWIEAVKLADGSEVSGDLFIDCSGFRGLLIEAALKTGYDEWTKWLPCDRAVAMPCENSGPLTPYTRATAREAGWQWRIPLQHRTGNGYVYSSGYISDDEAAASLVSRIDGAALADPRFLRFTAGRRKLTWNRNVVAIGLSGGFLEPLESTSIHLIQVAITTLIDYFSERTLSGDRAFDPRIVGAYNRWIEMEYDRVRDFLILHYHATERTDSPLWNYCRTMQIPDSLRHKMELFRRRARVVTYKDGLFLEPSWLAVYFGQRVIPDGYDPLADAVEGTQLTQRMNTVSEQIRQAVAQMPAHEDFLAQYCPAGARA
jgi:tryptophan halogenase